MENFLNEYYRLPEDFENKLFSECPTGESGFFRFGPEAVCFGRCKSAVPENIAAAQLNDTFKDTRISGSQVYLPFDPAEMIENLRREHYVKRLSNGQKRFVSKPLLRRAYYTVREFLPVSVRRQFQKLYLNDWKKLTLPRWPVDFTVDTLHEQMLRLTMEANRIDRIPFIWFWPDGAPNCLILTHDVETAAGRKFIPTLMDMDASYGFVSSFQLVPEGRYEIPDQCVQEIRQRGSEFNIHDLNHDGKLYNDRNLFLQRAKRINQYVEKYGARGFRAGAMYRNTNWFDAFAFSYDMSVPNVAHLEPQRGGCCTVMPYFIGKILELPLTICQDYTLFHVLNDYSIDLWKQQLSLLRERNGLMSFITHPDYLIERRARRTYESLLDYLREMVAREKIWTPLPRDVDHWWRSRSQMTIVRRGSDWEIQGPDKEKARLAYAVLNGGRLEYELEGTRVL